MQILEANLIIRFMDRILHPIMWLLGGLRKPVQETHTWHGVNVPSSTLPEKLGVLINSPDEMARYSHDAQYGLYHMPVFGGLRKYVVLKVSDFSDHWHVAWKYGSVTQIHRLKIKDNKVALLTGTGKFYAYAMTDDIKFLPLEIEGFGIIGDNKYINLRLF